MSDSLVRERSVDIHITMSHGQTTWPFVINVSNSIIGVTVLAMPFCFKTCGIILGGLLLFFSTWLTVRSCQLLMKAGIASRRRSYSLLAYYTHGATGKLIVELGMIGLQLGTLVAQVVIIGDLGPAIVSKFTGIPNTDRLRTGLIVCLCLFVGLPLGLLKDVRMLSKTSAMCIMFYAFFTVYVVLLSIPNLLSGGWYSKVVLWRQEGFFQCLPIFSFAFGCQTQLFIVYEALSEPSLKRINSIVSAAVHLCTAAYLLVGFFGYVAFCNVDDITGDIINHFSENTASDVIKLCFVFSIAVSIPLIVFPCRASLYTLLFPQKPKEDMPGSYKIPEVHFKVITTFIIIGSMIIGILVPNVEFVLGLNGATMGTLICYIFPALFFLAVMSDTSEGKASGRMVLAFGLTILIVSTYTTLNTPSPAEISQPTGVGMEKDLDKLPFKDDTKLDLEKKQASDNDSQKEEVKKPPDKDGHADDERHEPPIPQPPDEKGVKLTGSEKDEKLEGDVKDKKVADEVKDTDEKKKDDTGEDIEKKLNDDDKGKLKYEGRDGKSVDKDKVQVGDKVEVKQEVKEEEKKEVKDEVKEEEKKLTDEEEKKIRAEVEEKARQEVEEKFKEKDKKQEEILVKLEQQKDEQQKIIEEQKQILEELKQHNDQHKEDTVKSGDVAVKNVAQQPVANVLADAGQPGIQPQGGQQLLNQQQQQQQQQWLDELLGNQQVQQMAQGQPVGQQQGIQGQVGVQQQQVVQQQPLGVQQQPLGVQQQPIGVQQQPLGVQQQPLGVQQQPIGVQQQPLGVQQQPLGVQQQPLGVQQQPLGVQQQPLGVNQQPLGFQQQQQGIQQQQGFQQPVVNNLAGGFVPSQDGQQFAGNQQPVNQFAANQQGVGQQAGQQAVGLNPVGAGNQQVPLGQAVNKPLGDPLIQIPAGDQNLNLQQGGQQLQQQQQQQPLLQNNQAGVGAQQGGNVQAAGQQIDQNQQVNNYKVADKNIKPIVRNDMADLKQNPYVNNRMRREVEEDVDNIHKDDGKAVNGDKNLVEGTNRDLKQVDTNSFVNEFLNLNAIENGQENGQEVKEKSKQVIDKDMNELNNKINQEFDSRKGMVDMEKDTLRKR